MHSMSCHEFIKCNLQYFSTAFKFPYKPNQAAENVTANSTYLVSQSLSIGHAGHVQHIQHRTCSCFSSFSFFNPESVSFGFLGQSASLDGGNGVCCLGALFTIPPLSIKSNRKSCQAFMMTTLIYWTCTNIAYYYPTPLEMSKYNTATSKHRVQIYSVIVQYKTVFLTGLVKLWHTARHNF